MASYEYLKPLKHFPLYHNHSRLCPVAGQKVHVQGSLKIGNLLVTGSRPPVTEHNLTAIVAHLYPVTSILCTHPCYAGRSYTLKCISYTFFSFSLHYALSYRGIVELLKDVMVVFREAFHPSVPSSIHGWHHTGKKTLAEINTPPPTHVSLVSSLFPMVSWMLLSLGSQAVQTSRFSAARVPMDTCRMWYIERFWKCSL
jgi:hypothetical protein